MKVAFFDTHPFEKEFYEGKDRSGSHLIDFLEVKLSERTASLAKGHDAVCSFVNDHLNRATLLILKDLGIRLVALRSAGFNHVDLKSATELGLTVVRVPEYSPYAVAEHACALILTMNRKIHRAYHRVRDLNFSLDGLVGFDLHGKTVGIIGTGRIGQVMAKIMSGFGCRILLFDQKPQASLQGVPGMTYVSLEQIFRESDVISLHVPLNAGTLHLINAGTLEKMKDGVMIINTGRGGLIETAALIEALKSGKVGSAGLDVYEEEEEFFFRDLSNQVLKDDQLARLLTFPNLVVTSHQAFLTREALANIADTTWQNISAFERGQPINQVFWKEG